MSKPTPLSIPGKLLVLDDNFTNVEKLITKLSRRGVPVLYWHPNEDLPASSVNARILMVDINLAGVEQITDESYDDLAGKLRMLRGPYVVFFLSVNYDSDSPTKLEEAYKRVTGEQIPGYVIPINFNKTQPDEIIDDFPPKLAKVMEDRQVFAAIILAESILNDGIDVMFSNLTKHDFDPAVRALLSSILEDSDRESVPYGFVQKLSRLLTRNMSSARSYDDFRKVVDALLPANSTNPGSPLESWIHSRLMYYAPAGSEIWTGDIFETHYPEDYRKYAVMITPECDITNDKVGFFKFCYAFSANETELRRDRNNPVYQMDSKSNQEDAVNKYLKRKSTPARAYPLNHFLYEPGRDSSNTLIVDFQAVETIPIATMNSKNWTRICRLDSPYVEDLLQKYGAQSFRLGIPTGTS